MGEQVKRIGILVLHAADGIVDDYLFFLAKDLRQNLSELMIVANGTLCDESRHKLGEYAGQIETRADEGFDAWGWKDALERFAGWEKLNSFDEIVLLNDTFFGPLYPFSEVFAQMASEKADFWGLTRHYEADDSTGICEYGYIPEHIQSFFLVIRKRMHTSEAFKEYWAALPRINTFWELVCRNELIFTKYFSDRGFSYATYVDLSDMKDSGRRNYNAYIMLPGELIENRRMPVIKRKAFIEAKPHEIAVGDSAQARMALDYIRRRTDYDTALIWKNLLRTANIRDLYETLRLDYVLSSSRTAARAERPKARAAAVIYARFPEYFRLVCGYARCVPEFVDLFFITDTQEHRAAIEREMGGARKYRFASLLRKSGEAQALLTECAQIARTYDLFCFAHDCAGGGLIHDLSANRLIFENTLGSADFIENVLRTFEDEPQLGFLGIPLPAFAQDAADIYAPWKSYYKETERFLSNLGVKARVSEERHPFTLGSGFWCRSAALAALFERQKRAAVPDCGVLERSYCFIAQAAGYYSGVVLCDEYASQQLSNLQYLYRTGFRAGGYPAALPATGFRRDVRKIVDRLFPFGTERRRRLKKFYFKLRGYPYTG